MANIPIDMLEIETWTGWTHLFKSRSSPPASLPRSRRNNKLQSFHQSHQSWLNFIGSLCENKCWNCTALQQRACLVYYSHFEMCSLLFGPFEPDFSRLCSLSSDSKYSSFRRTSSPSNEQLKLRDENNAHLNINQSKCWQINCFFFAQKHVRKNKPNNVKRMKMDGVVFWFQRWIYLPWIVMYFVVDLTQRTESFSVIPVIYWKRKQRKKTKENFSFFSIFLQRN